MFCSSFLQSQHVRRLHLPLHEERQVSGGKD